MIDLQRVVMVGLVAILAVGCAGDEPNGDGETPTSTDGLVLDEAIDESYIGGQRDSVFFKAVSFQDGSTARARFWTADESEEIFVHVESNDLAEVSYNGVVIDGYGDATPAEQDALRALDEGALAEALAMVPLDLACHETVFEPVAMQALLFPWQLLLKYRGTQPEQAAQQAAQRSSCAYFEPMIPEADDAPDEEDENGAAGGQVLLSQDNRFPAVFGYAVLDAQGAGGSTDGASEERATGELTACGFGPGGSGCRGACGADCTSNNCSKIPMRQTICGQTINITRFICGVHQGCIDHDICYDRCAATSRSPLAKFDCLRGCDAEAIDEHGICNTYGWSRGFGTHSHTVDFYYHRQCGQNDCIDNELEERGRRRVRSTGDPHLMTGDRLAYDFQAAGEFVLVESVRDTDPFVVQVRQESAGSDLCPGSVAYNTALATRIAGRRVTLDANSSTPLRIDGAANNVEGGSLDLGEGAVITRDGPKYSLIFPSGETIDARARYGSLSVYVDLPEDRMGEYHGLLGDFDGDTANDISERDGTVLEHPVHFDDLYGRYADSWRITDDESLFDYAPGEGTDTYQRPGIPTRLAIDQLPAEVRESSRQLCEDAGIEHPSLLQDCIVDVGCTGDPSFADLHASLPEPDESLELILPVFMDGWTQEGDPGNGSWTVDESGRAVSQSSNDDPTFFVSRAPYFDISLSGTIEVTTGGDDDYVGFVFGWESPLSENGDDPARYRTYLLSWKQGEQASGEYIAEEGLKLGYIDGVIEPDGYLQTFWGHRTSDIYTPLGTFVGADTGWTDLTPHAFGLSYGSSGITVTMDGETVFDIDASEIETPLRPGRFGFYNYSQPSVRYSDFTTTQ